MRPASALCVSGGVPPARFSPPLSSSSRLCCVSMLSFAPRTQFITKPKPPPQSWFSDARTRTLVALTGLRYEPGAGNRSCPHEQNCHHRGSRKNLLSPSRSPPPRASVSKPASRTKYSVKFSPASLAGAKPDDNYISKPPPLMHTPAPSSIRFWKKPNGRAETEEPVP